MNIKNVLSLIDTPKKRIIFLVLVVVLVFVWFKVFGKKSASVQYQIANVEKGTLINNVSASGSIISGNYTSLTTKVSGTVKNVYVINGDTVIKGQKIANVELDEYAQGRQTAAWVSYLQATEAVKSAEKAKVSADIQMWKDRETILTAQEAINDKNINDTNPATHELYTVGERVIIDKTLDEARKSFSVSESQYLNADADISNARAQVVVALRDYQVNSATIVAPASGIISDLALASGLTISASSTTSNTSGATIVSSQTIGKINSSNSQLIATVNLSQMDIMKVKPNQKVTLTLDAYPDKTFTGKILSVNTNGGVSSGVTSYPVTILLDPISISIYPNMSVNAEIIISVKPDVLLIPSSAVQTNNGQTSIRVLKDNKVISVNVEIGSTNDTQTEIVSGLNEGDLVITNIISSTTTTGTSSRTGTTNSPFSSFGGGVGGGVVRFQGGGR